MKVVSFIEPPQTDVIAAILKHCGLWESRSTRAPPEVHEWVLELDPAYCGNSLDAASEADESHELTYVDIAIFLASLKSFPIRVGTRKLRTFGRLEAHFACRDVHFLLRHPPNCP